MNDWIGPLLATLAVAGFFLLRRLGLISPAEARRWHQEGALVIDVRSPAEFAQDHLRQAINVPLGELKTHIRTVAPDPSRPLLVHCLGGGRSTLARRLLQQAGYQRVHNLGSLARARRLLE